MSYRFTTLPISLVLIAILTSCSTSTDVPTSSATLMPTEVIIPTSTYEPSITPPDPKSPTPTRNPFSTQITISSPQSDDLFSPYQNQVLFVATMEDLPPSLYIIDLFTDALMNNEELRYVSLLGEEQGRLLSVQEIINLKEIYSDEDGTRVFAGFPSEIHRYQFNLSHEQAYKFEVCQPRRPANPSPSGRWLVTICTASGEMQDGAIVAELISLEEGLKYELEIPSHSKERTASNLIRWVTDDLFIASVGRNEEPCLVSVPELGMSCSEFFKDKPFLQASPKGNYLLVNRSSSYTWIKEIYILDCFMDSSSCDPIATLEDEYTSSDRMYWSPDETMLAVDFGDHLTSTTAEIGFYDTETWTYHFISTFPRSSGFFEWCPDSSCMIIVGDPSYILYLDGTRQEIPHDLTHPIALIEVP